MILELLLVGLFTVFCYYAKPWKILCVMFLVLPWHGFIKEVVFHDSGQLFTMWKEIGMIFILYKSFHNSFRNQKFILSTFLPFFAVCIIFLFIGLLRNFSFLQDVRRFIFPTIFLFAIAKTNIRKKHLKYVFLSIFLGAILIDITGCIDFFVPETRLAMRTIMGTEFEIGSDGTIYYTNPSYKIMGFDRVCGLMGGGPNMMGVFNAAIMICVVLALKNLPFKKKLEKIFIAITILFVLFNLFFSFSRAGWALLAITFFIVGLSNTKYQKMIIKYTCLLMIMVAGVLIFNDTANEIVTGTFSGDEASSAERGSMTHDSFITLLENPLGGGLGASNQDADNYLYFAESTIINLGFCTGFLGIILYCFHLISIYLGCKKNKRNPYSEIICGFIVAYTITAVVSVNVVANPFVYYAWFLMGLGLSRQARRRRMQHSVIKKRVHKHSIPIAQPSTQPE